MDVDENWVDGFFVEKRGDFAVDGVRGPQQGHLVRERGVAIDIVSQFSREVLKSERCHDFLLNGRRCGRWKLMRGLGCSWN